MDASELIATESVGATVRDSSNDDTVGKSADEMLALRLEYADGALLASVPDGLDGWLEYGSERLSN